MGQIFGQTANRSKNKQIATFQNGGVGPCYSRTVFVMDCRLKVHYYWMHLRCFRFLISRVRCEIWYITNALIAMLRCRDTACRRFVITVWLKEAAGQIPIIIQRHAMSTVISIHVSMRMIIDYICSNFFHQSLNMFCCWTCVIEVLMIWKMKLKVRVIGVSGYWTVLRRWNNVWGRR